MEMFMVDAEVLNRVTVNRMVECPSCKWHFVASVVAYDKDTNKTYVHIKDKRCNKCGTDITDAYYFDAVQKGI